MAKRLKDPKAIEVGDVMMHKTGSVAVVVARSTWLGLYPRLGVVAGPSSAQLAAWFVALAGVGTGPEDGSVRPFKIDWADESEFVLHKPKPPLR